MPGDRDAPRGDHELIRQDPECGPAGQGLAAPGFTDDPDGPARRKLEADPVDDLVIGQLVTNMNSADRQQRPGRRRGGDC